MHAFIIQKKCRLDLFRTSLGSSSAAATAAGYGRRYFADRGYTRKDLSDPNFQRKGYIDPSCFVDTVKPRDTNKSWKPPQYVSDRYSKKNDEMHSSRRRKERPVENHYSDYPFTGRKLDEYPRGRRKDQAEPASAASEYYFQDVEAESFEDHDENKQDKLISRENDEESSADDEEVRELVVRDRFEIRRTLAEDADEHVTSFQSFHRADGRLIDITGNMDEEWSPSAADDSLVFEMTGLFNQGSVATWEAEDVVRSFGGQLRPYHVFEVIKACRANHSSIALAFFRWAGLQPYFQHVTATYNMMLKLLQEDRKFAEMAELSKEMDNLEVKKSPETYKILLVSFFRGGFIEEALEMFSEMEKSATKPAFDEYKYVIDRMLNAECYLVVPSLFNSLTVAGHIPDSYTYNAVISSLCNVARMDEALKVFNRMKEKSVIDLFTYTILIDGFIKCHNTPGATSLFLEMLEKGCLPGEEIFNLLFGLHIKDGHIEQAVDLFRRIAENGCQPTVKSYAMLLDTFAMVDDLEGAYRFYKELIGKNIYPSSVSCNTLLSKLCKSGKTTLALSFFKEMKSFPEGKPNGITYNIAIDLYGKSGKYREAWEEFLGMKEKGCSPCVITYNTLIIRLGRGGLIENCFDLYEEMRGRGISANQYTYCGLIDVLTRYNQTDHALEFLEEMKQQNLHPSFNTLQLVIKSLWKLGNLPAAKKLCEDYPGVYSSSPQGFNNSSSNMAIATHSGARQLDYNGAFQSARQLGQYHHASMLEQ